MLFNLWLDQPAWIILAVLAAGFATTMGLIYQATFFRPARSVVGSLAGVVPPFFTTIGLLFGLLTGFLANDVWEQQRQASRAVQAERDSLLAISTLSIAAAANMAQIRTAVRGYVAAVVDDEWPRMADQRQSARAEEALTQLLREVASPKVSAEAGPVAHAALLTLVQRLRTARNDRLTISSADFDDLKWLTVLMLGIFTQLAMALVHLDRPRAQLAAVGLFSIAAVVVLGLLAVRERPFDGTHPIPDTSLRELLVTLPAPL